MLLKPRWWDITVAAGALVIAVGTVFGFGPTSPARQAVALAATAGFVLAYALIARGGIERPVPWRFHAFLVAAFAVITVGCAAAGFMAMLQTLAYPLVWVLGDTRRRGILGSVVVAAATFTGFAINGAPGASGLASGAATAGFSLVFAIALGMWIASIAEYGEERARLLADLTAAQAQVEALSRDRGAAEERERLARDIHDTLAQTLAGLVLLAERAGRRSREGRADAAADAIGEVEQVAREALGEARALVARTAAVPSDQALDAALGRLSDRFRAETGLDIDLRVDTAGAEIDRERQVVMLRCVQELLANVRKHSGASRVAVQVTGAADGGLRLEVADDGAGFDPAAPRTGFGLDGMRERVALAGGTLVMATAPGAGARVVIELPAAPVAASVIRGAEAAS
jgi:signal transduction histidine kinase